MLTPALKSASFPDGMTVYMRLIALKTGKFCSGIFNQTASKSVRPELVEGRTTTKKSIHEYHRRNY